LLTDPRVLRSSLRQKVKGRVTQRMTVKAGAGWRILEDDLAGFGT